MIRYKHPIEYELSPETLDKGSYWLTLRLKNIGVDELQNLHIRMHSIDNHKISFHSPSDYVLLLKPNEQTTFHFEGIADGTTDVYVSIRGRKNGDQFYWDSPWIREEVLGAPAELESILVSNPYGTIGKELDVDATVKSLDDSEGLRLEFWTNTPSGKYEELAEIKTKKLSRGEEVSYTAKITPKEEGYYTVYANLYDNKQMCIDRDSDTIWVERSFS
jgi:hypothetical protein